ncbi:MAG TPA: hypothetical protein VFB12_21725 [Ktedonobacteraceae bacterium]|nr:hypothetical protein [Ktedonobacteraceae bacterium]
MVLVPGTDLDTATGPQDGIRFMITSGIMTKDELTQFQQLLNSQPQLSEFESSLLPDIELGIARLTDIENVYDVAGEHGGIWSIGRIITYYERGVQNLLFVSQPKSAAKENIDPGTFEYTNRTVGVDKGEEGNSAGDSEVATLQELKNRIWGYNVLQGLPSHLHIILSSNMGPCIGCQGRLRAFINDLRAAVSALNYTLPTTLEINYTTARNSGSRHGLETTYGYNSDQTISVGHPEVYHYYSKTFDYNLQ